MMSRFLSLAFWFELNWRAFMFSSSICRAIIEVPYLRLASPASNEMKPFESEGFMLGGSRVSEVKLEVGMNFARDWTKVSTFLSICLTFLFWSLTYWFSMSGESRPVFGLEYLVGDDASYIIIFSACSGTRCS